MLKVHEEHACKRGPCDVRGKDGRNINEKCWFQIDAM